MALPRSGITQVHSWCHSYPEAVRCKRKGQPSTRYIEVNGEGRIWNTLADVRKALGKAFQLVYRGYLGMYEEVGSESEAESAASSDTGEFDKPVRRLYS